MKYIFFFIGLVYVLPMAQADTAAVYCRSTFTDEVVEITSKSAVDSCVADFIWGTKNVCFTGSPEVLAAAINSGTYGWLSSGYKVSDAVVVDDAVEYIGTDAMVFYSAKRTVLSCGDEFF